MWYIIIFTFIALCLITYGVLSAEKEKYKGLKQGQRRRIYVSEDCFYDVTILRIGEYRSCCRIDNYYGEYFKTFDLELFEIYFENNKILASGEVIW